MSPFGRLSSRAGRALEALAVTGCLLGVAVGPAAAEHADQDPHCKFTGGTNACLRVIPMGVDIYQVIVGIDVSMGAEDVQAILEYIQQLPIQDLFAASIFGDDGSDSKDDFLSDITLRSHGPGPNGYSAEFVEDISGRRLDEDDGRDEIVGKIQVFFPNKEQTVIYETGVVNHSF